MLPTKNDFVLAGNISNHRHEMLFVSKSSLRRALMPFLT